MFQCQDHPASANAHIPVDYVLYSCGGDHKGCGTFAFLNSAGPQDPCPTCGQKFTRAGKTRVSIGYCTECWPWGVSDQMRPTCVPVRVVGGIVALR